ncbi:NAD-binding protein [Acidiphilium sp. AL]|uniref:L-threonate dehydrogenase n=1 Tax=Acidiphilium sp. AL TaxID=2871704 RepID=UPI0021CB4C1A|nr:L-threonate dehydrogenase [Acidiphilium sp. AL]MCU4159945.1 NAD-binding protein [Acidiphilium sp. AL]
MTIKRKTKTARPRIAVIGLGSMGFGMASALMRAGFDVAGFDVIAENAAPLAGIGGEVAASAAEAARGAGAVVSVVVNAAQTEAILFGADGCAGVMPPGAVFISCATMAPDAVRGLAAKLEGSGRHYLDAPISGGAARAAEGRLTILASGSKTAFDAARPALKAMAGTLHELGDEAGIGAGFKMVNQLLAGVHIAAACEAVAFAASMGLDLRRVYEVITGSAGNSWMFENRVPHILDADYAPRSAVNIFTKDLGIVLDMARATPLPVPMAGSALQLFLMTASAGMAREDDAAVAKLFARIADISLPGR